MQTPAKPVPPSPPVVLLLTCFRVLALLVLIGSAMWLVGWVLSGFDSE